MKSRTIFGIIASGLLLLGMMSGTPSETAQTESNKAAASKSTPKAVPAKKAPVTCNGTSITANCEIDGAKYATYIYHPAKAEKSHTETITTYREEITSYCTLCNDGTYSPSCATGRGACSHHDGVAQWNAPVVRNVPTYETKVVIDEPAVDAYYEKILAN